MGADQQQRLAEIELLPNRQRPILLHRAGDTIEVEIVGRVIAK